MANSYLTRTPSSGGNRKTFTISAWFKKCKLSSNQILVQAATDGSTRSQITLRSDDAIEFYSENGGVTKINLKTNRLFRDVSAWYHIVVAIDTTQGTNTNRAKLYINGVQETSLATATYPDQNYDTQFNHTVAHTIGRRDAYGDMYLEGYVSHFALVDGTALTPTTFGQTDSTSGIWKFKAPSGVTWGTNGVHLKFENSGALGTDSSGNTNTFTVNGSLKQSIDTPSNVYPTLNPAFNLSDIQLTEAGMRTKNTNSNWKYINSTLAAPSGKWYCEHKININGGAVLVGVTDMQYATSQDKNSYTHCGAGTGGVGFYHADGNKYIQASATSFAGSYTTGDIIGCALDMDNNKVYFSKNGTWANGSGGYGSSTFDAAVGAITLPTTDATYGFAVSVVSNSVVQSNFGTGQFGETTISSAGSNGNGSLFEYDVPSGFYALNTKNINTYG